jgi:hypothetical protein
MAAGGKDLLMRRGLFLISLLALALAAACGGDEVSPGSAVADAATKTQQAGSSRMAFTAVMSGGGLPQTFEIQGEGEFDFETRKGRVTYDFGEVFGRVGGELEVVLDGLVLYMKWPTDGTLPEGKSWYRIDLAEVGKYAGIDVAQLSQLSQGDPSQMLLYLRGASSGVEQVGTEELRGAETTHYRAQVDLRKAVEQSLEDTPAETRDSVRKVVDQLIEQLGTREIPVDAWIDGEGRARKVVTTFDAAVRGRTAKLHTVVTMELFDFGIDVTADPPPPDETVDLLELMGTSE